MLDNRLWPVSRFSRTPAADGWKETDDDRRTTTDHRRPTDDHRQVGTPPSSCQ